MLGLFDMGSFNFDTPPADYTDVTPGFLLDFGDETGPQLQSAEVREWLHPSRDAAPAVMLLLLLRYRHRAQCRRLAIVTC